MNHYFIISLTFVASVQSQAYQNKLNEDQGKPIIPELPFVENDRSQSYHNEQSEPSEQSEPTPESSQVKSDSSMPSGPEWLFLDTPPSCPSGCLNYLTDGVLDSEICEMTVCGGCSDISPQWKSICCNGLNYWARPNCTNCPGFLNPKERELCIQGDVTCSLNPCENDGKCHPVEGKKFNPYKCECTAGFGGLNCQYQCSKY